MKRKQAVAVDASAPTIALVGTPNCGKTTLFNALTGLRQKVANYPGVTVEKKEGYLGQQHLVLLDLPGLYSLNAQTPDERVTREILHGESRHDRRPEAVLIILDGSALERSLTLASSILELGLATAAVLTMFDEIKARGGKLNVAQLSKSLGIPVYPIVGHRGIGVSELKEAIGHWKNWATANRLPQLGGAASRYAWATEILAKCWERPLGDDAWTRSVDRVVLHPISGPFVFLAVMAFFFQSIFSWAQPLMNALTALCSAAGQAVAAPLPDGLLKSLLLNGVFRGVGSVVAFLPQIMILFFLLFLLEDVGYMARAAFLMDRIMGWAGLQGRSFISLISSYACAVPGIMSTRTIPSAQDRLATILVAPFMTCSARLPVYALLIGAFIADKPVWGPFRSQGLALLGLYLLGTVSALAAARLFKSTILRGELLPFYMELPPYRFPALKSISLAMLDRARIFLRRAGKVILAASVFISLCLSYPARPRQPQETPQAAASRQLEYSLAGRFGKAIEPAFKPIGFDWRINIGIVSSLVAREVVVATLAQIYEAEEGDRAGGLQDTLKSGRAMSFPVALSLLAFFVYALQCFSTLAVMRRETGGWTWPAFAFGYMFVCAYAASWATYHLARAYLQ